MKLNIEKIGMTLNTFGMHIFLQIFNFIGKIHYFNVLVNYRSVALQPFFSQGQLVVRVVIYSLCIVSKLHKALTLSSSMSFLIIL